MKRIRIPKEEKFNKELFEKTASGRVNRIIKNIALIERMSIDGFIEHITIEHINAMEKQIKSELNSSFKKMKIRVNYFEKNHPSEPFKFDSHE